MITCAPEALVIRYPDIPSALNGFREDYLRKWLPSLLAADLPAVARQLLAHVFSGWSEDEKSAATAAIALVTPQRIEAHLREWITPQIPNSSIKLLISFHRTLRLPDDGWTNPLPASLGCFPLRSIECHADRVPADWLPKGGVLMPIHQAEALWLNFRTGYPMALKVGTGMINAVSGQPWSPGLSHAPQDYLELPRQSWLDGYCVGKGVIRQFVAARLGDGCTAGEQLCGVRRSGLQLEAIPLRPEVFFRKQIQDNLPKTTEAVLRDFLSPHLRCDSWRWDSDGEVLHIMRSHAGGNLGLGAGGTMQQKIYEGTWALDDWDLDHPARVWIHLCDAVRWLQITGELPPQKPPTAEEYAKHGLPWFNFYRDDLKAIDGSPALAKLQSVSALAPEKADDSLPQQAPATSGPVNGIDPHAPSRPVTEWDGN